MQDRWAKVEDQVEDAQYEVLILREATEDSLLEGAVTNTFGVEGLIKQFCRQNELQRIDILKDLKTDGAVEILGNSFHGMQYRMFVWTVKADENEF